MQASYLVILIATSLGMGGLSFYLVAKLLAGQR
jgi:hypothetical protein